MSEQNNNIDFVRENDFSRREVLGKIFRFQPQIVKEALNVFWRKRSPNGSWSVDSIQSDNEDEKRAVVEVLALLEIADTLSAVEIVERWLSDKTKWSELEEYLLNGEVDRFVEELTTYAQLEFTTNTFADFKRVVKEVLNLDSIKRLKPMVSSQRISLKAGYRKTNLVLIRMFDDEDGKKSFLDLAEQMWWGVLDLSDRWSYQDMHLVIDKVDLITNLVDREVMEALSKRLRR